LKVALVDLLFPPHCVACQRLGAWLCDDCLAKIETISPPVCERCGLPLASTQDPQLCAPCRTKPHQLDRLLASAFHSGPLRTAIHQFKYEDFQSLAGPLGSLMAEGWARLAPGGPEPDVLVPIPLHPRRQRQRGYNQATLLARELGSRLGRPIDEATLIRTKATAPQVDLNARERQENVRDAFACRNDNLSGQQVMLVDDVCTTGATLESAAVALQSIGARSIWAYTLARARPNPPTVLANTT
jgi:ComF family protein